jgi:hypothetical protein
MWNHSLADVLQNLILNKMEIRQFREFGLSPCFRHVEESEKGKWRILKFGNKIPLVYALEAIKKSS